MFILVKFYKIIVKFCNLTKIYTPTWVIFTFLKFYTWYQIAKSIIYYHIVLTKWGSSNVGQCTHRESEYSLFESHLYA